MSGLRLVTSDQFLNGGMIHELIEFRARLELAEVSRLHGSHPFWIVYDTTDGWIILQGEQLLHHFGIAHDRFADPLFDFLQVSLGSG